MTKILRVLFLVCACCYCQSSDVVQADRSYRHAMNTGDIVTLERLLTDDFLFIRRTGGLWDKKAFLENIKAGKLIAKVEEEDLKTRIYAETVIFTHKDSLKAADGSLVEMIATRVFIKQQGFWKLASVQDTTVPVP